MRKFIFFILIGILWLPYYVEAKEEFYKNKNGVSFSKEEYDFISQTYWKGAQELMTLEDYERYIASEILNGEIETKVQNLIIPYGMTLNSIDRNLKITKSCNNDCFVVIVVSWNQTPANKSYDVIGARFESTSLVSTGSGYVTDSSNKKNNYSNYKTFTNGLGNSVSLSGMGNSIKVVQEFRVAKSGKVYATYQHSGGNITLNNSKQYTVSSDGYGTVFKFTGLASSLYDRFGYVDISL